ncbi:MAG: zinc ABC transporter substrate-binding protein [Planctomycetota bacterium]|jgi:zinc transport system substrate-binding protein|nr:zinc ABC transporter substrate-binding protein [Planctomycetota bacterium]
MRGFHFLMLFSAALLCGVCQARERDVALIRGTGGMREPDRPLRVVATLFPQYDFARAIGGGLVEVSMLQPPGADSHSYEPNPSDMARLAAADLVLYAGDAMEPWAARIREAVGGGGRNGAAKFFDVSKGIRLIEAEDSGHDHDRGENGHDGDDDRRADHGHSHSDDPHFWLDPLLAEIMAGNIAEALAKLADRDGSVRTIMENAEHLASRLRRLHGECEAAVRRAGRTTLVFGGRFAFAYFFRRYGLDQVGVYDGCGPGVEPSVRRIVDVVRYVKDNAIPVVYHEELAEPRIARTIAEETGATPLMVHSLHNLSLEEFEDGKTFMELMEANLGAFMRGME